MPLASAARSLLPRHFSFHLRQAWRCQARGVSSTPNPRPRSRYFTTRRQKTGAAVALLGAAGATTIASSDDSSLRHIWLAAIRSERIARAVIYDALLYKQTFGASYASEEEKLAAYSACHKKSAERVLDALQANGGAYSSPSRFGSGLMCECRNLHQASQFQRASWTAESSHG